MNVNVGDKFKINNFTERLIVNPMFGELGLNSFNLNMAKNIIFEVFKVEDDKVYMFDSECEESKKAPLVIREKSVEKLFEKIGNECKYECDNNEAFRNANIEIRREDYYDNDEYEFINDIINCCDIRETTVFGKTTVVACKLPNGFVIVESSSSMSTENYNEEVGFNICMHSILDKITEYITFLKLDNKYMNSYKNNVHSSEKRNDRNDDIESKIHNMVKSMFGDDVNVEIAHVNMNEENSRKNFFDVMDKITGKNNNDYSESNKNGGKENE